MRLFIAGQKWLAEQLLMRCIDAGHTIAGVAAPDREDRLASAADAAGLPVLIRPRRLEGADIPADVDLIVAAHAHCFVTAEARAAARLGAIGFHPSLLPRHRGRDAIRWAIHMREPVTGGTVYAMDDGADTGPIIAQDWCHIRPDDEAAALWRRDLAPMGLRLLMDAIAMAATGTMKAAAQDPALATWEPAFTRPTMRAH